MEVNDVGPLGERILKCVGCTQETLARSVTVTSVRFHI